MKTRLMVVAALAVVTLAGRTLAQEEMKFKILSMTVDGKKVPKKEFKDLVLTVKGNKGVMKKGDKVISEGTSKMDQSKKPWTIDVTFNKGKDKGKTIKGIMNMKEKDGKMTICWGAPGKDRPKDFSSKKGSGNILEVYEPIKD
jgi:uncharacterized protein (TIGR03067 family)